MLAALLTAHNAPLTLAEIAPAGPLEFGQVLVRVLTSGLCGAQLQEIRGEKGGPLPHLMGHEGCGIVEDIGPAVTRVKPGDKVVMHWRKAAGLESPIPRYIASGLTTLNFPLKPFTSGRVTTLATHSICSENRLTPVPPDTDPALAALLGCGLSTALATLESETQGFGERILVLGCGGLGMALLGSMHLVAPSYTCTCDKFESKRRHAEIHGDKFVLGATGLADEKPFDLILDTAGDPSSTELALERLAPSGRYVMIGQPPPGKPVCINAARHLFDGEGKTIKATQGGGFRPDLDIPRFLAMSDLLMVHNLITHRLPLSQINQALDQVRAGNAGRVMIEMPQQ
jgi:Zn-dependent alcohol dehydrogenase